MALPENQQKSCAICSNYFRPATSDVVLCDDCTNAAPIGNIDREDLDEDDSGSGDSFVSEKGEKGGDKAPAAPAIPQQKSSSTTSINCYLCGEAFMGVLPWSSLDRALCAPCQLSEREKPDSSTAVQEGKRRRRGKGGTGKKKRAMAKEKDTNSSFSNHDRNLFSFERASHVTPNNFAAVEANRSSLDVGDLDEDGSWSTKKSFAFLDKNRAEEDMSHDYLANLSAEKAHGAPAAQHHGSSNAKTTDCKRGIKRTLPTSSVDNSDPDGSDGGRAERITRRNLREIADMELAIEESK